MKYIYEFSSDWVYGKIRFPALIKTNILGYFSSLAKINECIRQMAIEDSSGWYYSSEVSFLVFEVRKLFLDCKGEEQGFWIYDKFGNLYGGYDGPERSRFNGRKPEEFRFKPGDLVGFISGRRLMAGIVAWCPAYTPEQLLITDQSDDFYTVLTVNMRTGRSSHSHPWVHHVFALGDSVSGGMSKALKEMYTGS